MWQIQLCFCAQIFPIISQEKQFMLMVECILVDNIIKISINELT